MSDTYPRRTYTARATGSGSLTYFSGFIPSTVSVFNTTDRIRFDYTIGDPGGTVKTIADGTATLITTTGITWNEATRTLSFGTDAALNGTANKLLTVTVNR